MRAALLLLALVTVARAQPFAVVTGFEDVDAGAGTAADPFWGTEGCISGSSDTELYATKQRDHNATNGGHASGTWGIKVDIASGRSRCYEYPVPSGLGDQLCASVSMHYPSILGTAWTPLVFADAGGGTQCAIQVNTDGTVTAYHGTTATSFGTTATILRANACSNDPYRACTVNTDCDQSAGAATCVSCAASDTSSAGCFEPTLELCQQNLYSSGTPQTACDLRVSGKREVAATMTAAATTAPVTSVRIGAPLTAAVARVATFDDLVVEAGTRSHHGYVAVGTPTTDGTAVQFKVSSCTGGGTTHTACVDDWTGGAQYDSASSNNDTTRSPTADRSDDLARFTGMTVADGVSATVTAVARVLAGKTSPDSGDWEYSHALLNCASTSSCVAGTAVTGQLTQTADHVLLGAAVDHVPPGASSWSSETLGRLGVRYTLLPTPPSNSNFRVGGVLLYARHEFPDEKPPRNLRDHNLGTDDGRITVCTPADSLGGGTASTVCQGGENAGLNCTVDNFCSWDTVANGGHEDKPEGGCTADAQCQTCTGKRTGVNGGAGYQCSNTGECGDGTCASGVCSQNDRITCTSDPDCQGLGTCDTTATCQDACPNGDCPDRVGWPLYIPNYVNVDSMLNFPLGGESSWAFVETRMATVVRAQDAYGLAQIGEGVCACATNADCMVGGGAGGTCTGGLCTGGDAVRLACKISGRNAVLGGGDCATGLACVFDPCDYLVILEGANDTLADEGTWDPNCAGPTTYFPSSPGKACDTCGAPLPCVTDSTCTAARGPDARCIGTSHRSAEDMCLYPRGDALRDLTTGCSSPGATCDRCSVASGDCRVDAECPAGQTCSVNEPTFPYRRGFCECQTDGDCGDTAVWKCVGTPGLCRRKATTDADCSNPTRTGARDATNGVCVGQCTCPCSHTTCTTDSDCPVVTVAQTITMPAPWTYRGECDQGTGRCKNCGPQVCPRDPDSLSAFLRWSAPLNLYGMAYQFQRIQQYLDAQADADGRPVLIVVNQPEYFRGPYTIGLKSYVGGDPCGQPIPIWQDHGYLAQQNAKLPHLFTHVVDARTLMRGRCRNLTALQDACAYHSDLAHMWPAGSLAVGGGIGAYMATLNTCVTGTKPFQVHQKYCQEPDGDWTSTTCTDTCTGGNLCAVKVCLSASSDLDDTTATGCPGAAVCFLE